MREKERAGWSGSRPTIGLLVNSLTDPRDQLVWTAAVETAQSLDANLVCFPVGNPSGPVSPLYELIGSETLAGLIFQLYTDQDSFRDVYQRCDSLPLVNLLRFYEGYPGIVSDNYQGMKLLLDHLIEEHDYRRIAFIRGNKGHIAADARYQAYEDFLSERGLPLDDNLLVTGVGHFDRQSGVEAVRVLLDERKVKVDAVVACADATAEGVLEALASRDIQVPHQIAVTGFDNLRQGQFTAPPLTTVAQSWTGLGSQAVHLLLSQIRGEEIPERSEIPCQLVVRQSCGCWSSAVQEAGVRTSSGRAQRAVLVSEIAQLLGVDVLVGEGMSPVERLVDAYVAEASAEQTDVFLPELEQAFAQIPLDSESGSRWQRSLSVLGRYDVLGEHNVSSDASRDQLLYTQGLVGQGRVLVAEMIQRAQTHEAVRIADRVELRRAVGQSLLGAFDENALVEAVAAGLPALGVSSLFLSECQDPQHMSGQARAIGGYAAGGVVDLAPHACQYPSRHLLPPNVLPAEGPLSLLVEPLALQDQQRGFAVFGVDVLDGAMYDSLTSQLAAALRAARLVQEAQKRAIDLQTVAEVGRVASSILDPDELMQRTVDLVLTRLGLYYVGLYMLDESGELTGEPRRWAVLRAGTGQAGRQMLAGEHRLQLRGDSMVGQCIASRRARIAQDGEGAASIERSLLPHTRSELALPLISRGQAVGAMTIQSTVPNAFGEEDVVALQLMVDQLANAIQTAHLYAESQETVKHIQALYETTRVLSMTFDEPSLMRALLESVSRRLGCEYAIVSVVDHELSVIESKYGLWHGEYDVYPEWFEMSRYSLDEDDILVDVYRTGRLETISGWDDRFNREIYDRYGHERLLRIFAPIQLRDRVVGVIEVAFDRETKGRIDEQERQLLQAFVDQGAVALENTRLLVETQHALDEAEMLYQASQRIAKARDLQSLTEAVVHEIRISALNRAILWSAEYGTRDTVVSFVALANWHRGDGLPPLPEGTRLLTAQFPSFASLFEARSCLVRDLSEAQSIGDAFLALLEREQVRSLVALPIWSGERLEGGLMLFGDEPTRFAVREIRLLETLTGQMAVGLERLRLVAQLQARLDREGVLRTVTDQVRGAVDVETVLRTAVREVGHVLGRSAFVYLGSEEDLQAVRVLEEKQHEQ